MGILCGPWLLGRFAADGHIDSPVLLAVNLCAQAAALLLAWALLTHGRAARYLFALALAAALAAGLLAIPELRHRLAEPAGDATLAADHRLLARVAGWTTGRATLDLETSNVLFGIGRGIERLTLDLPADPVVDLAYGVAPELPERFDGRVHLEVRVRREDGEEAAEAVFSRTLGGRAHPAAAGWTPLTLEMSRWAGSRVELELVKRPVAPFESALPFDLRPTDLVVWRVPRARPFKLARKNVILISLDTVRADHLGFMGHERATSPNLDRLAARGVYFTQCISQAPWTTPAHFSILTGLYPSTHGGNQPFQAQSRRVPRGLSTLGAILGRAGYVPVAFTGRGSISASFGFDQGFDFYNETQDGADGQGDVRLVVDKALAWLERNRERSFFLFLHTYEPHHPYLDPYFVRREALAETDEDALALARYDGDIRRADHHVGRLLDWLEQTGLLAETLIVVTSDHGEEFPGDRGRRLGKIRHGHSLYDEQLRVPLVVWGLDERPASGRVDVQVRSIDILPTVLDALGLEVPADVQGASLRPLVAGRSVEPRPAYSEATSLGPERDSLRWRGFKYIRRLSLGELPHPNSVGLELGPPEALYDLAADPGESRNLAPERPQTVEELRRLIAALTGRTATTEEGPFEVRELDADLVDALRALGYVD